MDIKRQLDREFSSQGAPDRAEARDYAASYARAAQCYATAEGALAVLSDLQRHRSHVFHGKFSATLSLSGNAADGEIPSIWEQEILDIIHPDDLEAKMLNELLFLHHVKTLPKSRRFDCWLHQRLRMLDTSGRYTASLHRLRYFPRGADGSVGFALCLYGPDIFPLSSKAVVIDSVTGELFDLAASTGQSILTRQESNVLRLIDSGKKSKEIATLLRISVHTVSRHRQNIIAKLQARNSAEACKIARSIGALPESHIAKGDVFPTMKS